VRRRCPDLRRRPGLRLRQWLQSLRPLRSPPQSLLQQRLRLWQEQWLRLR
jgi:hypothetical protein